MRFTSRNPLTELQDLPVHIYVAVDDDNECTIMATNGRVTAQLGYINSRGQLIACAANARELIQLGFDLTDCVITIH